MACFNETASNSPAFKSHRLEREQNKSDDSPVVRGCHGVHGRQLCPECLALRKYGSCLRKCFFRKTNQRVQMSDSLLQQEKREQIDKS